MSFHPLPEAAASEGDREGADEFRSGWEKGGRAANTAHANPRSGKVYLDWTAPGLSGRRIFGEMATAEDPKNSHAAGRGFGRETGPEGRSAIPDNKAKTPSSESDKEDGKPRPDWRGIGRDTAFFMSYQVVFAGFLYLLPESMTSWTDDQKRATARKWGDNVRNPVWDNDKWWINYIGHPYFGATYYIRARERGLGDLGSFGYSALLSALFEFGIEAFFEPPSYQDLVVTPVGGYLLGKFVFEPVRENVKAKPRLAWHDHAVLIFTDPLGAVNSLFEWALGIKSDIRVHFHSPHRKQAAYATPAGGYPERRAAGFSSADGVTVQMQVEWE